MNGGATASKGAALSQFDEVSQTILVAENTGTNTSPDVFSIAALTNGGVEFTNHLGTSNYLFADGHVKALRPSATISGAQMWSMTPTADTISAAKPFTALVGAIAFQESKLNP